MLARSPQNPFNFEEGHQEVNAPSQFRHERRRRVRSPLHLPVFFFASESREAVETTTQNLSSSGFYCLSAVAFAVNDLAFCYIKIPIYQPNRTERTWTLKCRLRVVHVQFLGEDGYGVGCEIEDYCFLGAIEN
jgi:hypothetical protein